MIEKRRPGDRFDGRRLRSLHPVQKVSPYFMKHRQSAQNLIFDEIEIDEAEKYIRRKREEGYYRFGFMHALVAAYVRTVSQRPGINRFIAGQRVYARNDIEVVMTFKKEMTVEGEDSVIKVRFLPTDTAEDVYLKFTAALERAVSSEKGSDFERSVQRLAKLPGLVIKFCVWLLNFLDYFGLLPRSLIKLSPFHASFYITSMGSLGIPPVFHHLYDFGNIPIFCAFGAKKTRYELQKGGGFKQIKYIELAFVSDERIEDGYYFASALKIFKRYLKTPYTLDLPPESVTEDVE